MNGVFASQQGSRVHQTTSKKTLGYVAASGRPLRRNHGIFISSTPTPPHRKRDIIIANNGRRPADPIVPPVIMSDNDEPIDLMGYLLRNRIIFIGDRISDVAATKVVATLMALNAIDDTAEIKLYINCLQGSAYSVISILDTIKAISAPVSTVAFGIVGGTAAILLASGQKGRRFSMPSTRIMLQQPNGGAMGSADEVNIQASELNRTMKVMYRFLSEFSGMPQEKVEEECDRENFLSPKQAIELGIIDGIIE
jgi:ATP-dependent Clp protease protease subunit